MPGIKSPTALMLTVAGTMAGFLAAGEGDFGAGRGLAAGAGAGVVIGPGLLKHLCGFLDRHGPYSLLVAIDGPRGKKRRDSDDV